jgi:hypothetical protein
VAARRAGGRDAIVATEANTIATATNVPGSKRREAEQQSLEIPPRAPAAASRTSSPNAATAELSREDQSHRLSTPGTERHPDASLGRKRGLLP